MGVNRGPATRKACRRCANPACQRFFRPERAIRRYCSRPCAAACRSRASRVAAGKKGGTASGIKRRGASLEVIHQRLAGKTVVEGFLLGRKYGKADLGNLRRTARREGFAEGLSVGFQQGLRQGRYEAALARTA